MKVKIELTRREYDYLINNLLKVHQEILSALESERCSEDVFYIYLEEEIADRIREITEDRLGMGCFDDNYEPTEEGWILEHFIDKFYMG